MIPGPSLFHCHQARSAPLFPLLLLAAFASGGCATSECSVFNVHTVEEGVLIRGGQPDEEGFRELQQLYEIRTVVNFNDDTARSERKCVEALGMNYIAIPSSALDPERDHYLRFLKVMEHSDELGPVYVHCRHGMDRTGMAVGAWRILAHNWDAEDAVREMQSHRQFYNMVVFAHVPDYLRSIERDREMWMHLLRELKPPALRSLVAANQNRPDRTEAADDAAEGSP